MDITKFKNGLRKLFPASLITITTEGDNLKWEVRHLMGMKQSPADHEKSLVKVKEVFGDTFANVTTEVVGQRFFIYQKYQQ
jgi:hypothetical protein